MISGAGINWPRAFPLSWLDYAPDYRRHHRDHYHHQIAIQEQGSCGSSWLATASHNDPAAGRHSINCKGQWRWRRQQRNGDNNNNCQTSSEPSDARAREGPTALDASAASMAEGDLLPLLAIIIMRLRSPGESIRLSGQLAPPAARNRATNTHTTLS